MSLFRALVFSGIERRRIENRIVRFCTVVVKKSYEWRTFYELILISKLLPKVIHDSKDDIRPGSQNEEFSVVGPLGQKEAGQRTNGRPQRIVGYGDVIYISN